MSLSATFDVYGVPVPQGSKTAFNDRAGKARMKEGNAGALNAWRQQVAVEARRFVDDVGCLDGPLRLDVVFRFAMPISRAAHLRHAGVAYKISAPDTDKLVRAVGDALQASGLIADDARFAEVRARKVEIWKEWTGASISVRELQPIGGLPG